MEERLLALLDEYRLLRPAARRWKVLIQSFSEASLQKIHALEPSLPLIRLGLGFGTGTTLESNLDAIAAYAVGIGPAAVVLNASVVDGAHARCLAVHPWTVNDPTAMTALVDGEADGMFTNTPDLLDGVLGEEALRARRAARQAARNRRRCLRGR